MKVTLMGETKPRLARLAAVLRAMRIAATSDLTPLYQPPLPCDNVSESEKDAQFSEFATVPIEYSKPVGVCFVDLTGAKK